MSKTLHPIRRSGSAKPTKSPKDTKPRLTNRTLGGSAAHSPSRSAQLQKRGRARHQAEKRHVARLGHIPSVTSEPSCLAAEKTLATYLVLPRFITQLPCAPLPATTVRAARHA